MSGGEILALVAVVVMLGGAALLAAAETAITKRAAGALAYCGPWSTSASAC